MNDPMTALGVWAMVEKFGGIGVVIFVFLIWYFDRRDRVKEHKEAMAAVQAYREALETNLERYKKDAEDSIKEVRQMYVNNVSLVRRSIEINEKVHEAMLLAIQTQTRVAEMVGTNQYCPIVRERAGK